MNLEKNYQAVLEQLPKNVELIAVSKTHSIEKIKQIYDFGQRKFAENKVQELIEKVPLLPKDIQWHLIGHLQTNKVKYIAEFIHTIQSVDSEKILTEINKFAEKFNRKIKVFLQVKIAKEDSKYGLTPQDAEHIFSKWLDGNFQNVEITGLMGMATFTNDETQIKNEFQILKNLFDKLNKIKPLETLSMGMSSDFLLAIECGANSVRVGSAIFGQR